MPPFVSVIGQEGIYVGLVDPPTATEAIARNFPIADHVLDRARRNSESSGKRLDGVEGLLLALYDMDLVHQDHPLDLAAFRARVQLTLAVFFFGSLAVSSRSASGSGSAAIGRDTNAHPISRAPAGAALGSR